MVYKFSSFFFRSNSPACKRLLRGEIFMLLKIIRYATIHSVPTLTDNIMQIIKITIIFCNTIYFTIKNMKIKTLVVVIIVIKKNNHLGEPTWICQWMQPTIIAGGFDWWHQVLNFYCYFYSIFASWINCHIVLDRFTTIIILNW